MGLSGWARVTLSFEVEEGPKEAEAEIELKNEGSQKVWFGWPQLERGGIANHVNLLYNTDFTQGVETEGTDYRLPTGWSKDKDYAFDERNHVVNAPGGYAGGADGELHADHQHEQEIEAEDLPDAGDHGRKEQRVHLRGLGEGKQPARGGRKEAVL